MKHILKNHANLLTMSIMVAAMALAFLACEEKKKTGAEQAEAEAPPAEEASEAEGTPHEIQYGEPLTYEGRTYKTVIIGKQTWMAENLNVETGKSMCLDDDESNCRKYGRLYDWHTAMMVCSSGWHLPSYKEWNTLWTFVGGQEVANKKLKSKSDWDGDNGTDEYGFSALPCIYSEGGHYHGGWWSSDDDGDDRASIKNIYSDDKFFPDVTGMGAWLSVRCVKD